jgi:hypothetical protein
MLDLLKVRLHPGPRSQGDRGRVRGLTRGEGGKRSDSVDERLECEEQEEPLLGGSRRVDRIGIPGDAAPLPTPSAISGELENHQRWLSLLLSLQMAAMVAQSPEAPHLLAQGVIDMVMREMPPSFLCPLSQEVMTDPVLLMASGHTYQRARGWSSTSRSRYKVALVRGHT